MKSRAEIQRQIHNLIQKQSRLRTMQKNPAEFRKKERARHKKYWAELDPVKKKAKIARQSKQNKKNRKKINAYQRKSYKKHRLKILAKKKAERKKNPEKFNKRQRELYHAKR